MSRWVLGLGPAIRRSCLYLRRRSHLRRRRSAAGADRQLARDMLKTLVEINTTHARGSTEAAKAIQGWLSSAGFPAGDAMILRRPIVRPREVVVRYRGKTPGRRRICSWATSMSWKPSRRTGRSIRSS